MPKIAKIILIFFLIFALGMLGLCMIGYRMITGSLPRTDGEIAAGGLHRPVHIYRDGFHIPHIFAENEHDLFFAQGFVTAQDRLWQMDLWKRVAAGRLSEVFGAAALPSDSLMRIIGIRRTAERILSHLSPESLRTFEAYSEGVNAYLSQQGTRLPVEFMLLDYEPESWTAADCISLSRWLAWNSNPAWSAGAAFLAVARRLGTDKARSLFPGYHSSPPHPPRMRRAGGRPDPAISADPLGLRSALHGSNAWVVSGSRSATGKPLLANDPHLALTNPSIFYETHLVGGGFNVTGFSIPGLPGVILGHNEHIAWGIASLMADDLDLCPETAESGSSNRTGRFLEETLAVRGDTTYSLLLRAAHHGPIVTDVLPPALADGDEVSVRWTGHDVSDEGLAYYLLNRAENWRDFRSALKHYRINPQVFLYADVEGNIGLQAAGDIPVKPSESSGGEWTGFLPFRDLPSVFNPPQGFLVAANHRLTESANDPSQHLWALPSRTERIRALLGGEENLSLMDVKRIQADVVSPYAKTIIAAVKPILESQTAEDLIEKSAAEKLLTWQGEMKSGSAEALLFETFLQNLLLGAFAEALGEPLFTDYRKLHTMPLAAIQRFLDGSDTSWWDREERERIVVSSFRDAVAHLKETYGDEPAKWSWGAAHTLTFRHPLGEQPLLRATFNLGPFPVSGSGTTVNCLGYGLDEPYGVVWGPAARMVIDLDNFDNSISVLPTGQSGQPMDEHFRDQVQLYTGNLYHPNLSDTSKIVNSGWDLLILNPGGPHE